MACHGNEPKSSLSKTVSRFMGTPNHRCLAKGMCQNQSPVPYRRMRRRMFSLPLVLSSLHLDPSAAPPGMTTPASKTAQAVAPDSETARVSDEAQPKTASGIGTKGKSSVKAADAPNSEKGVPEAGSQDDTKEKPDARTSTSISSSSSLPSLASTSSATRAPGAFSGAQFSFLSTGQEEDEEDEDNGGENNRQKRAVRRGKRHIRHLHVPVIQATKTTTKYYRNRNETKKHVSFALDTSNRSRFRVVVPRSSGGCRRHVTRPERSKIHSELGMGRSGIEIFGFDS